MTTIVPLNDYVLVEVLEEDSVSTGGILIPDTAKQKPVRGVVIEAGFSEAVNKGDVVLFKKWGGNEVRAEGKDMLLILEEDILAVVGEVEA